ncbi:hypothetical protein [Spongiactinospora sp. TRM90649]|uniref:hypothetical protein n=1 Tax=Spongiactinospora sp. TRM90649 TaxID=3031114 RepID=UPI0023F8309B|nr:hypothetical protein [Spongiactinospora sp. TRM90649]MDF5759175.1 hypothetical protein [Spongiactinospora sp. TRM90649]
MSLLRSYLKARALTAGRAQPAATVRHFHLARSPMVFVPVRMAGEAAAPLGAMVGCDPADPHLLVVPQPRDRDLRFAFAAELASIMVPYIEGFAAATEEVEARTPYDRCLDAPQILLPTPAGIAFTRMLGRSTRFRRTHGPYAVDPAVPVLGRWLTFLCGRAELTGSAMLLPMTAVLGDHWVTGQSDAEDAEPAALLGWIDPPDGMTGAEAAAVAEDRLRTPSAGPDTDPDFDRRVLQPAIAAYDVSASREQVHAALDDLLRPTWDLMWRGVELLRGLPEAASATVRWERDRASLARESARVAEGGLSQGRWDTAVTAARRLAAMEGAQQTYEANRAFDDPLVMAGHRAEGVAFAGEVVAVDADRKIIPPGGKRAVARPLVTVKTDDPLRLAPGRKVLSPSRPKQKAHVVSIEDDIVVVQLNSGIKQGEIPVLGETVCYADLDPEGGRRPPLPPLEETPWTHGGPPEEYVPTDHDAEEEWS